jgi:hypothetical protein
MTGGVPSPQNSPTRNALDYWREMAIGDEDELAMYEDAIAWLTRLEEQFEAVSAERDRISREGVGAVLKWSDRAAAAEEQLEALRGALTYIAEGRFQNPYDPWAREVARDALDRTSNPASRPS